MSVTYNNPAIREKADAIVSILKDHGFIIQRYDSYSTDSVYLKLDYGVCNSIRISDHEGKKHLCYRYNMIIGCEDNIIEEKYIRYYFNEKNISGLINQILFDKTVKLQKYGRTGYHNFMVKNKMANQNSDGFWKQAKLVEDTSYIDPVTGKTVYKSQMKKSRTSPKAPVKLQLMPDGTYACGPQVVLDKFSEVITDNMKLNAGARFKPDEQLKVTVSFAELKKYYLASGETNIEAETHALQVLGRPGYNVGTNLGATQCEEGMFYTIELPLVPMEFLPEDFLDRA